ncbi:hypothetical protein MMC22_004980 [Lobaria immixta]|nr:hypothetical protein [Lobaria immixta]
MAATKTTRRPRRSPIKSSTNRRGAVTKSVAKGNRKTVTKASDIIGKVESESPPPLEAVPEKTAPFLEVPEKPASSVAPSQVKDVEPSDKKDDNTETAYDYKVIQFLDFPGHTFENGEERKVLATFDDLKKANRDAWEHYEALAVFSHSTSSTFHRSNGMAHFTLHQGRFDIPKTVRIEVHKEERKARARRGAYVVVTESRQNSTSGVYQDLESALKHMQHLSEKFRQMWMPKGKVGGCEERDYFERVDEKDDGTPAITLVGRSTGSVIQIRVLPDLLS